MNQPQIVIPEGSTLRTMSRNTFSDDGAQFLQRDTAPNTALAYAPSVVGNRERGEWGVWDYVVENGEYGFIPVETSKRVVWKHLDLFWQRKARLLGEVNLYIEMLAMGTGDTPLRQRGITHVHSMPEALAQSEQFIQSLGAVEQVREKSTAEAARIVAELGDPNHIALASESALHGYDGLHELDRDVADRKGKNYTQFMLVHRNGDHEVFSPESKYHAAIIHPQYEAVGSLRDLLGMIRDSDINLTSIHSREQDDDHSFYVEMEAIKDDPRQMEAFYRQLEENDIISDFSWLGSWDYRAFSRGGWENIQFDQEPRVHGQPLDPSLLYHKFRFKPQDYPGSLYDVLNRIAEARVNLLQIDSRTEGRKHYSFDVIVDRCKAARSRFASLIDELETVDTLESVQWDVSAGNPHMITSA